MQPFPKTVIDAPEGEDVTVATTAGAVVPAWLIVSVLPCRLPMMNVREFGPRFGAMLRVTAPLPVPEAPETTVIAFGSLFVMLQSQPGPAIMLKFTVPPPPGTTELSGLKMLYPQLPGRWRSVTF